MSGAATPARLLATASVDDQRAAFVECALRNHDSDLSYDAEDAVIQQVARATSGVEATVEVRNEARVHLWYAEKFGVAARAFTSSEDAIDHFTATTCCFGLRREPHGGPRVYAPHGFGDLFAGVIRPNSVLAPAEVYEAKTARWQGEWPWLRVLPWPIP